MQDNKPLTSDPHDTLTAPPKATYIPPHVTQLTTNPHTSGKGRNGSTESGPYIAPS
jgi:hypothetical protein